MQSVQSLQLRVFTTKNPIQYKTIASLAINAHAEILLNLTLFKRSKGDLKDTITRPKKSSFTDACDKVNAENSSNLCIPDNSLEDIDTILKMPRSWKLDLI